MDIAAIAAAAGEQQPMKVVLPAKVPGRELHIDGDYAAYFCAGNDDTAPGIARRVTVERFEGMAAKCGAEKIIVHLTASGSDKGLRYFAATVKPYQAQRKGSRKPKNWQYLRDFLETYDGDRFRVKVWQNREADDGIALCAYHGIKSGNPIVIATRDKDMRMLPGIHMDWMSQRIDAVVPLDTFSVKGEFTELQYGYKWLLLQLLQGDTADNIPGLERVVINGKTKQVGEKTAEDMLSIVDGLCITDQLAAAWSIVEDAYESYYGETWAERMAEQLCLLYMRHDHSAWTGSWMLNDTLCDLAHPALVEAAGFLSVRIATEVKALAEAQGE